ncbi:MAG: phosphotransferase, partial [Planctomycetota bacterium]
MTSARGSEGFLNSVRDALDGCVAALGAQRWFRDKGREVRDLAVLDVVPVERAQSSLLLLSLVRWDFERGSSSVYLVPWVVSSSESLELVEDASCVVDELLRLCEESGELRGSAGSIRGFGFRDIDRSPARPLGVEQSNDGFVCGDHTFVKLYRKVESGANVEAEMLGFLSSKPGVAPVPRLLATFDYIELDGRAWCLGLAQEFASGYGDAWEVTTSALREYVGGGKGDELTRLVRGVAKLTAIMHGFLVGCAGDVSEPPSIAKAILSKARELSESSDQVDGLPERCERALASLSARRWPRIRAHGDYHLGQVLVSRDHFLAVDFEGEPGLPLAERRVAQPVARDVAGMLRSFHYAAAVASQGSDSKTLNYALRWAESASAEFLDVYRAEMESSE